MCQAWPGLADQPISTSAGSNETTRRNFAGTLGKRDIVSSQLPAHLEVLETIWP